MARSLPASTAGTAFPGAPTLSLPARPGSCNSRRPPKSPPPTAPRGIRNEHSIAKTRLCSQPRPTAFRQVNAPGRRLALPKVNGASRVLGGMEKPQAPAPCSEAPGCGPAPADDGAWPR